MGDRAAFPPGAAREDWAILRALSDPLGHRLPFDSLNGLRAALYAAYPHFAKIDAIEPGSGTTFTDAPQLSGDRAPFASAVADFYLTNPIARASAVMAECSALAQARVLQAAE